MENREYYFKELLDVINDYMPSESIDVIKKYYDTLIDMYEKSGNDYKEEKIIHPIRVAIILAQIHMDTLTVGCALIHEAIKDDMISYEDLENEFSSETASILNSISKLSQFRNSFKNEDNSDRARRIVVNLSENPVSLFIKLADRLDILRNINNFKIIDVLDFVHETEDIYIPIAHRLGIKKMKSEMEDICLRLSDPEGYNAVVEKINASREELESSLYKMRDEIIKILNEHEINYELTYRVKSVRGIYNKLKLGKKWDQIYDLLGLRVLVDKKEECYLVIGYIHSKFRPIPKRFKDFIANPKNNMYQSIHTTVFGVDSRLYEIQVRTHEMDEIAEHGVASHWSYKEHTDGSKSNELEEKLAQFRTLIELNDVENNSDFFNEFNSRLAKDFIYVFTPKGDIIELPVDSTPIDFAYKIHSQIGDDCIGALVNGKLVSLDYALQDGDIVELKIQKGKGPSKAWLKFVKTDSAKSRIKSYFYKQEKDKTLLAGREIIISEIKKRHYNPTDLLDESITDKVASELKLDSFNDVLIGVSTLKYTPNFVVGKLIDIYDPKEDDTIEKLLESKDIIKSKDRGNILVAGYSGILTSLANCCSPVPGDDIVGYVTKGNGVKIHRKDCKFIESTSDRLIDVSWNEEGSDRYTVTIKVYIDSSNERLVDIITLATKSDTVISSINNKGHVKNDDVYELVCKVKNKEFLDKFLSELSNCKFISKVER